MTKNKAITPAKIKSHKIRVEIKGNIQLIVAAPPDGEQLDQSIIIN